MTQCFWCGEPVFYHTNGYADCVLLDDLGPPWPVHHCWRDYREERGRAIRASTSVLAKIGAANVYHPLAHADMRREIPPQEWWNWVTPDGASNWIGPRTAGPSTYEFDAPPIEPDLAAPGPYMLLGFVTSHSDRFISSLPQTGLAASWAAVETGRGLTMFMPREHRGQIKVGDPLICEIFAVGGTQGTAYLVTRFVGRQGYPVRVFQPPISSPRW